MSSNPIPPTGTAESATRERLKEKILNDPDIENDAGNVPMSPYPPPEQQGTPTLPIKGSVRVWLEIKKTLTDFGDAHFSVDRSMIEHWEALLVGEMSDDLKARIPELQKLIEGLDKARFVSRELLNRRIDV